MLKSETATLLAMCATFDRRTVGKADVEAWHAVLADLGFEPCRQAVVGHYSASRDWIMPSDVRDGATRRLETPLPRAIPLPDADPDDPPAYIAALRAGQSVELEDGPGVGPIAAIGRIPAPAAGKAATP